MQQFRNSAMIWTSNVSSEIPPSAPAGFPTVKTEIPASAQLALKMLKLRFYIPHLSGK